MFVLNALVSKVHNHQPSVFSTTRNTPQRDSSRLKNSRRLSTLLAYQLQVVRAGSRGPEPHSYRYALTTPSTTLGADSPSARARGTRFEGEAARVLGTRPGSAVTHMIWRGQARCLGCCSCCCVRWSSSDCASARAALVGPDHRGVWRDDAPSTSLSHRRRRLGMLQPVYQGTPRWTKRYDWQPSSRGPASL